MTNIERIANAARGEIDTNLLTKSMAGDASSGYLIQPAIEYISQEEKIEYVFHNKTKGIELREGFEERYVNPDKGWTIVVITDMNVYMCAGAATKDGNDVVDKTPIYDLTDVHGKEGIFKNKLEFSKEGTKYIIPVQSSDDVTSSTRYIRKRKEGTIKLSDSKQSWTSSLLYSVSPITFEKIISQLWEDNGYKTRVTQESGDKGIDVVANSNTEKILIQAKRYNPETNKVGIKTVQRIAGLLSDSSLNATSVIVVTTSSYTKSALESGRNTDKIELINGAKLVEMLQNSSVSPSQFNLKVDNDVQKSDKYNAGERSNRASSKGVCDFFELELIGYDFYDSDSTSLRRLSNVNGYILAFSIENTSEFELELFEWESISIIDSEGYSYPADNQPLKGKRLPGNWQGHKPKVPPNSKSNFICYFPKSPDNNISRVRFSAPTYEIIALQEIEQLKHSKVNRFQKFEIELQIDAELRKDKKSLPVELDELFN